MYIELQPTRVTDIIFRMHEYIAFMREIEDEQALVFATNLEEYVVSYFFERRIDRAKLKRELLEFVNDLYIEMANLEARDYYTDAYFDIVLGSFFYTMKEHGVLVCFILEDAIPDEEYILVKELFEMMTFTTVTPYERLSTEYEEDLTTVPVRNYFEVEDDLQYGLDKHDHLIYLENRERASYIHRVLDMVENEVEGYQYLYRNKPRSTRNVLWLRGKIKTMLYA